MRSSRRLTTIARFRLSIRPDPTTEATHRTSEQPPAL